MARKITIEATSAGFHILSGTGTPLSPNVLLKSLANPAGELILFDPAGPWVGRETVERGHPPVTAEAVFVGPAPDRLGQAGQIAIETLCFARIEHGQTICIGNMRFDQPLIVPVRFDVIGPDQQPGWIADAGRALAETLKTADLRFEGGTGLDVFAPAAAPVPVRGSVEIVGGRGDDVLHDLPGDTVVRGGAGDDVIVAHHGVNRLLGGRGDDVIRILSPEDGNIARGGPGADIIFGGRGSNILAGGAGPDVIHAEHGDNLIMPGPGNDRMISGTGADSFVFRAHHRGRNIIEKFDPDQDRIVLVGLDGPDAVTLEQRGADVAISWDAPDGRGILLAGTDLAQIAADDFVFL